MKRSLALVSVAAFLLAPSQVQAQKPVDTTFFLELTNLVVIPEPLPSGVLKLDLVLVEFDVTGDWVGDWEHSGFAIINPKGTFFAFAVATFTGTVLGVEGTLEIELHTNGTPNRTFSKLTILSGTGDLANLRGQGTEEVENVVDMQVHFSPR